MEDNDHNVGALFNTLGITHQEQPKICGISSLHGQRRGILVNYHFYKLHYRDDFLLALFNAFISRTISDEKKKTYNEVKHLTF